MVDGLVSPATPLVFGVPLSGFLCAQSNIHSNISDTLSWTQSNKLKLNAEKNEVMLVGSSKGINLVGC